MAQMEANQKSKQLELSLTEAEVTARIGSPSAISVRTCGGANGITPWTCKQYNYYQRLTVTFHQSADGTWRVNDWSAY
jgi:hypothetical protein